MSPDLAALLQSRGIRLKFGGWLCEKCRRCAEKWNWIAHEKGCSNETLLAERYAEVESRPKTPSIIVNPNGDASIECKEESNNGGNAVGN